MSEAELHVLRQRLWQGALQKARRGELASKGPIGYVRDGTGLAFDPDEQAQGVVRFVFEQFDRLGTMNAVLRELVGSGSGCRCRPRAVPTRGGSAGVPRASRSFKICSLTRPTVCLCVRAERPGPRSRQPGRPCRLPPEQWLVLLRDRHPAYISWEQYEANQERLRQNRSRYACRGSVRSGRALAGRAGRLRPLWLPPPHAVRRPVEPAAIHLLGQPDPPGRASLPEPQRPSPRRGGGTADLPGPHAAGPGAQSAGRGRPPSPARRGQGAVEAAAGGAACRGGTGRASITPWSRRIGWSAGAWKRPGRRSSGSNVTSSRSTSGS